MVTTNVPALQVIDWIVRNRRVWPCVRIGIWKPERTSPRHYKNDNNKVVVGFDFELDIEFGFVILSLHTTCHPSNALHISFRTVGRIGNMTNFLVCIVVSSYTKTKTTSVAGAVRIAKTAK